MVHVLCLQTRLEHLAPPDGRLNCRLPPVRGAVHRIDPVHDAPLSFDNTEPGLPHKCFFLAFGAIPVGLECIRKPQFQKGKVVDPAKYCRIGLFIGIVVCRII